MKAGYFSMMLQAVSLGVVQAAQAEEQKQDAKGHHQPACFSLHEDLHLGWHPGPVICP
jgi:hypothetical protein